MNRSTKIILITTLGLGTATAVFFILRKMKQKRDFGQTDGYFKNNNKGNAETESLKAQNSIAVGGADIQTSQFDPHPYAERILATMKGAGTYEDDFFDVYEELTPAEAKIVNRYFDDFGIGGESTLAEWVEDDFNGWLTKESTYQKAKRLIKY